VIDSAIIDHVTLLRASKLKTIMMIDIVGRMFFALTIWIMWNTF